MAVEVIAFSVHKLLSLRIHTIHTYESTHNGGLFIMAFCALKIIYLFPSLLRLKGIPNKRASLWLDGMLSKLMYVAVNCVMEDDALTHSRNRCSWLYTTTTTTTITKQTIVERINNNNNQSLQGAYSSSVEAYDVYAYVIISLGFTPNCPLLCLDLAQNSGRHFVTVTR